MGCNIINLTNFNLCRRTQVGGLKHVLLDLAPDHLIKRGKYTYDTNLTFEDFEKNIVELPVNCYSTGLVSTSIHNNKANYSATALTLTINEFHIKNFNELKTAKPVLYYQTNGGDWGIMTKCRATASSLQTGTSRSTPNQMKLTYTEEDLYVKECGRNLLRRLNEFVD